MSERQEKKRLKVEFSNNNNNNNQISTMGICEVIYNKETGAIFTRTPASWGKIGAFYFVYYTCLAAFFAGLLAVFLYGFTDDKAPLLVGEHSVLPPNPGMGFRPRPVDEKTMIKYSVKDKKTFQPYIDDFNSFLDPDNTANTYMKGQSDQDYTDCSKAAPSSVDYNTKPCKFLVPDIKSIMDNCVNANYGFEEGTPCIAVKVNRIFEFMPELMEGTGDDLKIQCRGEQPADEDNIGKLSYYPQAGADETAGKIDMFYYPFVGQHGYLSPLVFVKMLEPKKGVLIQIVCTPVNAANIEQDKMKRGDGRVTLEVLIDA